jgi:hypothetical protein
MGSFALCKKKTSSSLKKADLRDVVNKASKYVCTSVVLVTPDPLSPTVSTLSDMKPPENTEEDRYYPNQQMKEIARLNTPLINSEDRV